MVRSFATQAPRGFSETASAAEREFLFKSSHALRGGEPVNFRFDLCDLL